ncbi:MAG: hypothetical protein JWQ18_1565 [Conexibacter sp.]|nr:hypothetical protein [Conexibacter sp.]
MKHPDSWRDAVGDETAASMLAEAERPEGTDGLDTGGAERLLLKMAQAGNAPSIGTQRRLRGLASGADAGAGAHWRGALAEMADDGTVHALLGAA